MITYLILVKFHPLRNLGRPRAPTSTSELNVLLYGGKEETGRGPLSVSLCFSLSTMGVPCIIIIPGIKTATVARNGVVFLERGRA